MSDNDDRAEDKQGTPPLPAFPGAPAQPEAPDAPDAQQVPPAPETPKAPDVPQAPSAPVTPPQAPAAPPQAPSTPPQAPAAPPQAPSAPQAPQQPPYAGGQYVPPSAPPQAPGAPQYGAPQNGAPQNGAPQNGAPQNGAPQYGAPQYGAQPTAGYAAPKGPKRKLGTGALIGIIGGAILVVVLLVVGVVFGISRIGGMAGGGGGGGGEEPKAQASSPSDAVTDYLTAIADGDAKTALGYLSSPPNDSTLLTDEALAASAELAPITEIDVPETKGESGSADVTATYLLNGEPITTTFSTSDYDDDGKWEISGGTGSIYTEPFDGLGLTINGVEVDAESVEVFPGTYELATSLKNFTLSGPTTVTITEPYESADTSQIKPALTEEALQQFRGLVRAAVDACIASTTLAAGCGIDLPATISDGTQLADGTITRSLSADSNATLDSLEATPSYDNPTLVEGEYIGSPSVEADCTKDGATGRCSIYFAPALGTPSVDMASDNPVVNWD